MTTVNSVNPASQLLGVELDDGWRVTSVFKQSDNPTGGNFSKSYVVESKDGRKAFLKALDYSKAFNAPDPARAMQMMTTAYNFERDVLETCKQHRLSRVVTAITSGSHSIFNAPYPVSYLIFELADGDARKYLDVSGSFDTAWALRSLHHTAIGIQQLHSKGIAHQDLKPSNVLVFNSTISKIGDVGRASMKGFTPPHESIQVAGDSTYAPLELLYGHVVADWNTRRLGCDLYLLGSLILFYFMDVGMTSAIMAETHQSLYPDVWTGTYEDVLPYIRSSFNNVIDKLENCLKGDIKLELVEIVRQLCEPDPIKRGHPKNKVGSSNPYSIERYISKFDALATKAELGLLEV